MHDSYYSLHVNPHGKMYPQDLNKPILFLNFWFGSPFVGHQIVLLTVIMDFLVVH